MQTLELVSRCGMAGCCLFGSAAREGCAAPQWYRNLGVRPGTPPGDVFGRWSSVCEEDRRPLLDAEARVRGGAEARAGVDVRICDASGDRWARVELLRLSSEEGMRGFDLLCLAYDITGFKLTERTLIEARNRADVNDRLKSAFLADMSHEIRTPLNAIVGFSNLLTETDDPEERNEFMRIVNENNELLLNMISDILDLSKIEAGTLELNCGPVDVDRMCAEVVQMLRIRLKDDGLVQLRYASEGCGYRLYGDKSRLMQVLANFITNAIKFTERGSIVLDVAERDEDLCFSVTDTGCGIAAEAQPAVFDRFVRLGHSAPGSGLGLPICRSIVEQMGGRIGVESELGRGSRFWFSVPRRSADEADCESDEGRQPLTSRPHGGRRPLLLVAEDTDSNYLLVSLLLRRDYELVRACDGEEAVRLCAERHPDAVLMDIRMPVMDGLEATRRIRRADSEVPIIAVTAFAYEQDRHRALDAGCSDYLSKPISAARLRELLRRSIG